MLSWPLLGSLRLCLERRPPLVCFCLCLISLATAFAAFATYIQSHEVRDPDVSQNWNLFLESLSHHSFCADNRTWGGPTALVPTSGTTPTSPSPPPDLSVLVGLTFDLPGGNRANATRLALMLTGHQLGLEGADAQQPIHLVAVTPWPLSPTTWGSCLSLMGPPVLMPQTSRVPPHCIVGDLDAQLQEKPVSCYQPHYQPDPTLDSMLTLDDRRLCSHRLLLAAVTVLSLCAMLLCTAGLCLPPAWDARGRL
uniref:Transmembrane protein 219 n=1 Tax=Pelusios castaneus TaxID=367368 RepID=A0A8C8S7V9_9SAUR